MGHGKGDNPRFDADEATIFRAFASSPDDLIGLAAFALHRRAMLDFRAEFAARQGRAPNTEEETAFLIGETGPTRIAAYREAAARMAPGQAASEAKPVKRRMKWPLFGSWVESPLAPEKPDEINWRGLLVRLLVLLLAVIATAILLRVLFVRA